MLRTATAFLCVTTFLCIIVATRLWADCAPDYRSDKKSGVFIEDFIINGTSSLSSENLLKIRSKLTGACVDEEIDGLEQLVRALFQNEGYYSAVVKNLDIHVVDPLARPKIISLQAEVAEGNIFQFGQANFVGNHAVQTAELRNALSFRKGEVFKRDVVVNGLEGIRKLYLPNGFGDLTFIPEDAADFGNSTVNLTLTLMEGPQYHMGKLVIVGKQDDITARLQTAWAIPEGAVFDFGYPAEYIQDNRKLLPNSFSHNDLQVIRNCPEASVAVWLILQKVLSRPNRRREKSGAKDRTIINSSKLGFSSDSLLLL